MRWIKFLAGLGTILVFIGIYCFKGAFDKEESINLHAVPSKKYGKGFFILVGTVCIVLGVLLILMAIREIM